MKTIIIILAGLAGVIVVRLALKLTVVSIENLIRNAISFVKKLLNKNT
ncbi:MAG: hypothetical protein K9H26_19390 [Prolixibacteraceae bacterium]|nr:hypothetical protein [Prolixibacteraceae bacterium]